MSQDLILLPNQSELQVMQKIAIDTVKSGFLPKSVNTPEKAMTIMLKGRELDIPPMAAFAKIHVIDGQPSIAPELMLALILRRCPGMKLKYKQMDSQACIIDVLRPGQEWQSFTFTIDDAKNAGLLGKTNWKNYPRAMLRSRAIAEMARALFPDVLMGASYTPEELGAEVDEGGDIIRINNPSTRDQQQPVSKQTAPNDTVVEKIIIAFDKLGVSRYMLEDFIGGKRLDEIDDGDVKRMRDLFDQFVQGKMNVETLSINIYGEDGKDRFIEIEDSGPHTSTIDDLNAQFGGAR